ncbi:hypothetical protein PB2503_08854 [Parvularcula bermudensis HTCC2503]|uniref:Capsule biosynthesis protein n=1 Tax=Parvularcula bermudensis (strain ATCC BAA-594 / HTCC2503 / KCTC 12087) TaxID=314260 RepID=E0TC33_PARBH|nr:DUF6356 family protein [Parvularcula bermudensis]ADM09826.1 hypothetical protein PB2503_08854 [Parvularcula bermudensis HTCC2503]
MSILARLFREHPASVGESYPEHARHAGRYGLLMIGGGLACLIHALLPFAFKRTGSDTILSLSDELRQRRAPPPAPAAPPPAPAEGSAKAWHPS